MKVEIRADYIAIQDHYEDLIWWTASEWQQDPSLVVTIALYIKLAYTNPHALRVKLGRAEP